MWSTNTLNDTLKPLWFLNYLLCLRMYQVKKHNHWLQIFSLIYRFYYCSVCIVSVTVLIMFLPLTQFYNNEIKQYERYHTTINQLFHLFQIVQGMTFQMKMKKVTDTMDEIDVMFRQLGIKVTYRPVKIYLLIQLLLIVGLFWSYFIYYTCEVCETSLQWCIVTWLVYYNNRFIAYFTILEFCVFVYVFSVHFTRINAHLKNLNLERYIKTFHANDAVVNYDILSIIKSIKVIQNKLYQTKQMVNNLYATTLFLSYLVCFTEIYFLLHYFIIEIDNGPVSISFRDAIFHVLFTIYTFYKLKHIVTICENTRRVHLETGSLLYDITVATDENRLLNLIHEFSLDLAHQESQFSVYGFFNINYDLLETITNSVISNLFIIAQFHLSNVTSSKSSVNYFKESVIGNFTNYKIADITSIYK